MATACKIRPLHEYGCGIGAARIRPWCGCVPRHVSHRPSTNHEARRCRPPTLNKKRPTRRAQEPPVDMRAQYQCDACHQEGTAMATGCNKRPTPSDVHMETLCECDASITCPNHPRDGFAHQSGSRGRWSSKSILATLIELSQTILHDAKCP